MTYVRADISYGLLAPQEHPPPVCVTQRSANVSPLRNGLEAVHGASARSLYAPPLAIHVSQSAQHNTVGIRMNVSIIIFMSFHASTVPRPTQLTVRTCGWRECGPERPPVSRTVLQRLDPPARKRRNTRGKQPTVARNINKQLNVA